MEKIIHYRHSKDINNAIKQFENLGFQANKLASAVNIFESMINDKDCKVFLGVAGALVPAGLKNIIIDMIESKYIDVLVITGANLTHDLIEDLGYDHFKGHEEMDDNKLNKKGFVRIFNTLMPNKSYQGLEDFFKKNYSDLSKQKNIKDFLWTLGKLSPGKGILKTCYENRIPIFCPAISDSGIGLMIWGNRSKGINSVNAFDDLNEIIDISWTSKKKGVVYFGGGTPKNYIQQAMQFSKEADYAIQITMDRQEFGGSSGAELKEGISWGKLNNKAKYVNLACDLSIAVPLIYSSLKERIKIN